MSIDESTTSDLIETLKNGEEGFRKAAEKLADSSSSDLSAEFVNYSEQRGRLSAELASIAHAYGDDIPERSTVPGAIHRGWMAVKDTFTGSSPAAVLKAALTGEDHAVAEYEDAIKADISEDLRAVLARQLSEVSATRTRVKALTEQQH